MADHADDELAPSTTDGFKLGDKKTVDEYRQLGKLILAQLFMGFRQEKEEELKICIPRFPVKADQTIVTQGQL
jgi:hypothetical protein